jgi:4-hydroxy-tetrahydrodipicolinate reductase
MCIALSRARGLLVKSGEQTRSRVLLLGAMGRMGQSVRAALADSATLALSAALEAPGHPALGTELAPGVKLGADLAAALPGADVAIAFATPAASMVLMRAAAERALPCVVGTTGFGTEEQREIEALAKRCALIVTANFSVAVNVLKHLTQEAARMLGPDYDAEILELHHTAKVDAPSGTALELARAIEAGRAADQGRVLAREGHTGARPHGAIGLQTLRGGDNPGEHTVMFIGRGERLELAHRAATRDHFARGAVRAAGWVRSRPPGLYEMKQVLGLDR